jgi:hypothetical protein
VSAARRADLPAAAEAGARHPEAAGAQHPAVADAQAEVAEADVAD